MNTKRTILTFVCTVGALCAPPDALADFVFGEPVNLGPTINSTARDLSCCVSYDGLELYFASNRGGGQGGLDLWVSTRPTREDVWGPPRNLGQLVNSSSQDLSPSISADGLDLYFHANYRSGGLGEGDIWVTRRAAKDEPWSKVENLGPLVNSGAWEYNPCISSDGLALYLAWDGWVAVTTRAAKDHPWEAPVYLSEVVNGWVSQDTPWISSDELLLVFTDNAPFPPRPGGFGGTDVWLTRRSTKVGDWEQPVNVGSPVNTAYREDWSTISADGSTLYFTSDRPGGYGDLDLWQAPILSVCDFNGDGQVDGKDLLCMASQWGTNDPLCDIGPYAWGDGTVDLQDVVALSEYIGKEVIDSTLVAHWPLDETEGIRTREIVSNKDDIALGDVTWKPTDGKVNGALQLDGVDDSVVTSFKLNPADGPFSVLVWINGGAPGQVIISQSIGSNYLMLDAEGKLMTELANSGLSSNPLQSETIINDGQWHRVGLIWDGQYRMLCVDNAMVAEDMQDDLGGSGNGLYIGTGKSMQPGTFFSGLIDDVRIYNRAVKP